MGNLEFSSQRQQRAGSVFDRHLFEDRVAAVDRLHDLVSRGLAPFGIPKHAGGLADTDQHTRVCAEELEAPSHPDASAAGIALDHIARLLLVAFRQVDLVALHARLAQEWAKI